MTGVWDSARPTEGAHATFLEFVDGAAATLVYNAYDHFDSDELTGWIGEGGERKRPDRQGEARRMLREERIPPTKRTSKPPPDTVGANSAGPLLALLNANVTILISASR